MTGFESSASPQDECSVPSGQWNSGAWLGVAGSHGQRHTLAHQLQRCRHQNDGILLSGSQ